MKFSNKTILVTGANGFIGRHLCKKLHLLGGNVIGLVRKESKHHVVKQYVVDISDSSDIKKIVTRINPDIVIHLAAEKFDNSDDGYRNSYKTNLLGSINLIQSCQQIKNLEAFIYIGSCEEYGHQSVPFDERLRESPVSSYGCSKLAVTQFLQSLSRSCDFPSFIIRPSVVYGPGQSNNMFVPSLINALIRGNKFDMTSGEQTRDFVYIDDMVEAIILSCKVNLLNGQIVNISSGEFIDIKKIAIKTANLISPSSIKLLNFGVKGYRKSEVMNYYANNSLSCEMLRWSPKVNLTNGLISTISHYKKTAHIVDS